MSAACGKIAEGGVFMRDKRADTAHIRLKLFDQPEVTGNMLGGLIGRAYHKAASHLIAKLAECVQAGEAVLECQFTRVQSAVMPAVGCLVPEQIAVGTCISETLVAVVAPLAQRQGDGAVRELLLNAPDHALHPLVGKIPVLSPLQHKGAKTEGFTLLAAGEDIVLGEAVAVAECVAAADAAVEAVVLTDIGYLNQSADKHVISINLPAYPIGTQSKFLRQLGGISLNKLSVLGQGQRAGLLKLVGKTEHCKINHSALLWI